jgi:hypothetical protein
MTSAHSCGLVRKKNIFVPGTIAEGFINQRSRVSLFQMIPSYRLVAAIHSLSGLIHCGNGWKNAP